ncbi:hypothetical protein H4R19_000165 [Coemansia spiralis]|nr:hypothetical protein H4R19_000165 [Coemansia spiralis]
MDPTDTKRTRSGTDNAQRYDRQLRLWHKDGQSALEAARVVVLGSSTLASESLKNLVLPGIGEFVVVDDALVSDADVRTNFFVRVSDIGQPRAERIVENLAELNPDVRGRAVLRAPASVLTGGEDAALLDGATVVIACAQPEPVVRALSERCWTAGIPLLAATSSGFLAELRMSVCEHTVVESHADARSDLRVMTPFDALRAHADAINLDALNTADLAHVPQVVLLIKALDAWAADAGAEKRALTFAQKKAVAATIRRMSPGPDEENFAEAAAAVTSNCGDYVVPADVARILADPAAAAPGPQASPFWLLAGALRRYMDSEYAAGMLPHSGTIPDMKADTASYVELQRIYKQKADQDKAELVAHLQATLRDAGLPADHVPAAQIDAFCKNAGRLRLLRTTPLHADPNAPPAGLNAMASEGVLAHYALFRAADRFLAKHGRHVGMPPAAQPADLDALVESDARELVVIARDLLAGPWAAPCSDVPEALAAELARGGFQELHNVLALTGGIVAQEAIKLITHQYVPHDNICIIDTANSKLVATKA